MPLQSSLKRIAGTTLRISIALAGILFVIFSLTWSDQLTLAPGTTLPNGQTFEAEQQLTIVNQTDETYTVRIPNETTNTSTELTISRTLVDTETDTSTDSDQPAAITFTPGILTMLQNANWAVAALGLLFIAALILLQAQRWRILLHARDIVITYPRVLQLTLVGLFFSICLPGMTGGDVVKGYYAVKGGSTKPKQRTDAIMSIVIDRLCGMVGIFVLVCLVGIISLVSVTLFDNNRLPKLAINIIAFSAVVLVGLAIFAGLYFHPITRNKLLALIPNKFGLNKLSQILLAYANHPKAVLQAVGISAVVHFVNVSALIAAAYAMGIQQPTLYLFAILPIVVLVGSIPLFPMGIGTMEAAAAALLTLSDNAADQALIPSFNQIAGMLLIFRLYLITFGLASATLVIRGNIHLHPPEDAQATTDDQPQATP